MKAERLHQVSPIFRQAVELPPDERAVFLHAACRGDAALRRDVERLISAHERAGSFIEAPAYERAAGLLADKSSAPAVGPSGTTSSSRRSARAGWAKCTWPTIPSWSVPSL